MTQEQKNVLKILQEEFAKARTRNSRYSVRAFARKLGIPASALSGILNGKLPITKKTGEKILQSIPVDPVTKASLMNGLKYRENKRDTQPVLRVGKYNPLDMDQFHLICDWYYFGILSLATTESFQDDPAWISETLGIQKREAKAALARLERLELLARTPEGKLAPTGKQFQTSNGTPNAYLRRHHIEGLDLARRAMEEDEFTSCDFSSITMGIDPAKLPEAKRLISDFRKSLAAVLESDAKKEVYRMSVQLFPLSNRKNFNNQTQKGDVHV